MLAIHRVTLATILTVTLMIVSVAASPVPTQATELDTPNNNGGRLLAPVNPTTGSIEDAEKVGANEKDGGWIAWRTVLGSSFVCFCTFGLINSFGIWEAFYVRNYLSNRSPADVAWIGSAQVFLVFFLGPLVGKIFDSGYFHHLIIAGSILEVIGLVSLSFAKTYLHILLSQGLCVGLGMSFLYLPAVSVIQHHFHRRRALATGLSAIGTSVGGVAFSLGLNYALEDKYVGFAMSCRIAAGVVAVALLVANLTMRAGISTYKVKSYSTGQPLSFAKDIDYILVVLGCTTCMLSLLFTSFYIQLDAEMHGVPTQLTFYLVPIFNAASIPGRVLPTAIADHVGIINTLIVSVMSSSVIILAMLSISFGSTTACIMISIFAGFCSGSITSLFTAVIPSVSRGPHEYGLRMGFIFFATGPAGLLSGPVAGWLLGPKFLWTRPIVFFATVAAMSGTLFLAARRIVAKKRGVWNV
ncbi:MFS general substrate transporter [Auriculariales sp. MPI-PUGE-AT-0066]|nr:MFS general substrate transporter [Auriculariales sp. MPI-PUGE-AT-0066]